MYEFLFQEEWWMDTIIAATVTAIATLMGSYFLYLGRIKKLEDIMFSSYSEY